MRNSHLILRTFSLNSEKLSLSIQMQNKVAAEISIFVWSKNLRLDAGYQVLLIGPFLIKYGCFAIFSHSQNFVFCVSIESENFSVLSENFSLKSIHTESTSEISHFNILIMYNFSLIYYDEQLLNFSVN